MATTPTIKVPVEVDWKPMVDQLRTFSRTYAQAADRIEAGAKGLGEPGVAVWINGALSDTAAKKLATALMASDTAEERATLAQWEFVTLPWYKRLWYWVVSIWYDWWPPDRPPQLLDDRYIYRDKDGYWRHADGRLASRRERRRAGVK